jgi:hypothetical protein
MAGLRPGTSPPPVKIPIVPLYLAMNFLLHQYANVLPEIHLLIIACLIQISCRKYKNPLTYAKVFNLLKFGGFISRKALKTKTRSEKGKRGRPPLKAAGEIAFGPFCPGKYVGAPYR